MEEVYCITGNIMIDEFTRIIFDDKILTKKAITFIFNSKYNLLFSSNLTAGVTTLIIGWHKDGNQREKIKLAKIRGLKIIFLKEFLDSYNFHYETRIIKSKVNKQ